MSDRKGGRAERVAARIQEEISELLLRGAIHEPDASGLVCSSVRVTPDLSIAHVGLRTLETEPSEARKARVVAAMRRAAGFTRREIAGRLGLQRAPELRFHWDSGVDHARRIESLLEEVRRERGGGGGS